jgi:phosphoribosylaminoimidazolecarboxamide formyltransferase/IMP cyclohydrolase
MLCVSDKTGLVEFAHGLSRLGWELIATSGTETLLRSAAIPVQSAHDYVEYPQMFGGRIKTLDVRVFAGLLYRRGDISDEATMRTQGLAAIDLLACTFQPFEAAIGKAPAEAVESIDIGGPAMVRAAAKNCAAVIPLVDPADYGPVLAALERGEGTPESVPAEERRRLAAKAFRYTEAYDRAIVAYLEGSG